MPRRRRRWTAEAVYCFFGKSGVHAFSHDGEALWNQSVGTGTHGWGSGTSPVLFEDLVIVNAFVESGALVALDKKTGEERWRAEGLTESWNTPALVEAGDGKTELAVGVSGKVLGVDPKTGEKLWESKAADWYVVPSIVSEGGVLYTMAGKGFEATTAIRAGGRGEVTGTHRLWQARKGSNVSSPVLHDGAGLLCARAGVDWRIVSMRRRARRSTRSGFRRGCRRSTRRRFWRRGGSTISGGTGRDWWWRREEEFKVLATNPPLDDGKMNASPAVVGDRLLVRTDKALYCLGK